MYEEEVVVGGRARSLSLEFEQLLQTLDHPLEPDLLPLPEDEALTSIESTPIDHRTMLTPRRYLLFYSNHIFFLISNEFSYPVGDELDLHPKRFQRDSKS